MGVPLTLSADRARRHRSLSLAWVAFACEGFAFSAYFSSSVTEPPSMSTGMGEYLRHRRVATERRRVVRASRGLPMALVAIPAVSGSPRCRNPSRRTGVLRSSS